MYTSRKTTCAASARARRRRPIAIALVVALVAVIVASPLAGAAASRMINGATIRGGTIRSAQIRNFDVRSVDLAPDSVTTSKIRNGAVHAEDIANGTITGAKLRDGTLTGAHLAAASIGARELASGAVTNAHIAAGSVGTDQLRDEAVTLAKLHPDARPQGAPLYGTRLEAGDPDKVLLEVDEWRATLSCTTTGGNSISTLTLTNLEGDSDWGYAGSVTYGPGPSIPGDGEGVQSVYTGGNVSQVFTVDSDDTSSGSWYIIGGHPVNGITFRAHFVLAGMDVSVCLAGMSFEPAVEA